MMKLFHLIGATQSDYSQLQNIIDSSHQYIGTTIKNNKKIIVTNCFLICEEYVKRGGEFTYIDFDPFESMSI